MTGTSVFLLLVVLGAIYGAYRYFTEEAKKDDPRKK